MPIKVILLSDVSKLGNAGAVVDVADGYARNFLLPRGLAAEASQGAMAVLEQQRAAKKRREEEARADAEQLAVRLADAQITVAVRAGGNGRLFGAVTNAQVSEAIKAQLDAEVDRHKIDVPDNIKSLGSYPVEIKLGKNLTAKTTVKVVPE